jgi:hypothetical protein
MHTGMKAMSRDCVNPVAPIGVRTGTLFCFEGGLVVVDMDGKVLIDCLLFPRLYTRNDDVILDSHLDLVITEINDRKPQIALMVMSHTFKALHFRKSMSVL